MNAHYDVVVCGGGVAGLAMARHLRLYHPELSVLVLDRAAAPSPVACHKVGESIPEGAAYHLRHALDLGDYLFSTHVPKLGFRFFFGGGGTPLWERLEYGGTQWPPFATFQLDRGILENDLRDMVSAGGATCLSRCSVRAVELSEGGEPHRVTAEHDGRERVFTARWVVDATGRRRLLATQLGLRRPVDHRVSATWWRIAGRVDPADLVDRSHAEWHGRIGPPRWYSTNHLSGPGYWVWLIPLASDVTSIGIVADEAMHPVHERASHEGSLAWCRRWEPELATLLEGRPALDFGALKHLAHSTARAFSHRRWSCVGDAAAFADPLYALGQDLIGHAVSITGRLIEMDLRSALTQEVADGYNRAFLEMFEIVVDQYRGAYPTFSSPFVHTQKLAWDSSMYFGVLQQTLMQNVYDHPEGPAILERVYARLAPLNRAMQRLFIDAFQRDGRLEVDRGMRTWAPRVGVFADASLDKCPPRRLAGFFDERLDHLEGIASVIFADVLRHSPSITAAQAGRVLAAPSGIQPRAASLDPDRWEADGLFDPARPAIDFAAPAQFCANRRIQAELNDFSPVHYQFRATARAHRHRVALQGDGEALTYGELWERVQALAGSLGGGPPGGFVGVRTPYVGDGVVAMLASLCAGRAFVPLDPAWSAEQCARVAERYGVREVLDGTQALPAGASAEEDPAWGDPGELRARPAYACFRYTPHGAYGATVDHAAAFRMCRWLGALMRKEMAAEPEGGLRCLYAGPCGPELMAPLLGGARLVVPASEDVRGEALRDLAGRHTLDVVMARPAVLQGLLDAGWSPRGTRVVSVGEALPRLLGSRLLEQAERVCDFGYATFAH